MLIFIYEFIGTSVFVLFGCETAAIAVSTRVTLGFALAFVYIMVVPLTGTSVNLARSLATTIFLDGTAIKQVWVFVIAPFIDSILATFTFKFLNKD